MKKSIFVVAVLAAFSFASCKKDYNCVCESKGVEISKATINSTKKKSKDACRALDAQYSSVYPDVSCTIK